MSRRSLSTALQVLQADPALEGAFGPLPPRSRLSFSLHAPGLAAGTLTLLDGPARIEGALRFLAEHRTAKAAWVEARLTAYPPGFVQRGVDLACLLFIEGQEHFPWAVIELVRSQAFKAVVVASPLPDGMALRRLQLAAERAATVVLLAAPLPAEAWPVRTRLWCAWKDGELALGEAGSEMEAQAAR